MFADISSALDAHTNLLALPTAWENKSFEPVTGQLYLRATLLPAGTEPTGFSDASDEHIGVYQVDVIAPSGKGKGEAMTVADQVADHFKRDTALTANNTKVTVTTVSRTTGRRDGAYFIIGIEVRYRSFTPPR